jgi:hypothetical protein
MDTTTIEITTDQREQLEQRKQDGSYNSLKAVIADLLETGDVTVAGIDAAKAREIAQDEINEMVRLEALE